MKYYTTTCQKSAAASAEAAVAFTAEVGLEAGRPPAAITAARPPDDRVDEQRRLRPNFCLGSTLDGYSITVQTLLVLLLLYTGQKSRENAYCAHTMPQPPSALAHSSNINDEKRRIYETKISSL